MTESGQDHWLKDIRLIAFDVDGVFTDGRFYLSDDGVESKAFHTQDGYGIRRLLSSGFHVAIISGRRSKAVELRMGELGVENLIQGCDDKIAAFDALLRQLGLERHQGAYVGDDLPDMPLLEHAGISFAVANAVEGVRSSCDFTTRAAGGNGAVREICDLFCAGTRS